MPSGVYKRTPEHIDNLAAALRGKRRTPEQIERMREAAKGATLGSKNGMYRPLKERFWQKVQHSDSGCWEWLGSRDGGGYGMFQYGSRDSRRAHRVAWELTNGEIPTGMFVLHSCDYPPCVNPAHLRLGTNSDNMKDMWARNRRIKT